MTTTEQFSEHARSYYAATANSVTTYPALCDSISVDVCVIGAGFTGVSTALTLAERGYSVALLDANRVGWGASGRNGGQVINGLSGLDKIAKKHGKAVDDLIWDMRWRGNDIIRQRVEKYSIDCDLKSGFAEVAVKPSQLFQIEAAAAERQRRNVAHRYEVWDRHQTCANLGTDAYHGAFVCFRDGHVHPLNLCIGEAQAAVELGVKVFEHSPVTGIEHGKRPVVSTPNGQISADAVVIAGNAYSQLEPSHLSNLVFPAGSYIIATEVLPADIATSINKQDVAVCDLNAIVDYFRLSADRRLLFGGACNYSGRDPASIESYILPRLLKVYPQLDEVRIEFEWGGKIGIVLNRVLTAGRIGQNLYYCQGYSGHGVGGAHLMGEVMADAVSGTMERLDLFADMQHIRIPGSRWMGNQLIALGMLYYRLKDKL